MNSLDHARTQQKILMTQNIRQSRLISGFAINDIPSYKTNLVKKSFKGFATGAITVQKMLKKHVVALKNFSDLEYGSRLLYLKITRL
jgi:hypothetical protein